MRAPAAPKRTPAQAPTVHRWLPAEVIERLADEVEDAVILTDGEGRIVLVNQRLVELFGYSRGELAGRPIEVLLPERLRAGHLAERARFTGDPNPRPMQAGPAFVGRHRDGHEIDMDIALRPVQAEDGVRVVATLRPLALTNRTDPRPDRRRADAGLAAERERIARDLHNTTIQRLFTAALSAQSLQSAIADPTLAARAAKVVDDLDTAIRELRSAVFDLQCRNGSPRRGLRRAVLALLEEYRGGLGVAPQVSFAGPVDAVPEDTALHLLAFCREALANVARHANATTVEVAIEAADVLVLAIADDGVGLGPSPRQGNGLRNMAERARALGGTFRIDEADGGGTVIECCIPLAVSRTTPVHRGPFVT